MKEEIINCSILKLQKAGLRFSIDEVAASLKISKKTIYKYFPTKEDLAVEMYKTFYSGAIRRMETLKNVPFEKSAVSEMLTVYFESHCMVRKEIFNKYALNESIRDLAVGNHNKIRVCIEKILPQKDREAFLIIVDGSLQKLCEKEEYKNQVIDRLVALLC